VNRILFLLVLVIPLVFPSLNYAGDNDAATRSIRVGIYNNKPLLYIGANGQGEGFFADIVEYAVEQEGWQLEYVVGTWEQCLARLENGQIDLLGAIGFTKSRDKIYDFNRETVVTNWGELYVSPDSTMNAITDLSAKKVAILGGDVHGKVFKYLIKEFGIECEIVEFNNYAAVLEAVAGGVADAGVVNRFFGLKNGHNYAVKKSGALFNPIGIHYAVKKGRNRELLTTLDRYIRKLKNDQNSVYYKSFAKCFGSAQPDMVLPRWLKGTMLLILLLAALLVFGNHVLRQQIKARTKELRGELKRRQQAEITLRESENNLRIIFSAAINVAFVKTDLSGDEALIVDFSPGAEHIFGYSAEEVVGKPVALLHLAEDVEKFPQVIEMMKNQRSGFNGETILVRSSGETFPAMFSTYPVFENGEMVAIIGVTIDISERKQAEEQRLELAEQLQQKNKMAAIGVLAGGIAHDFNNNLAIILGNVELAQLILAPESAVAGYLGDAKTAVLHSRNLVKQIMAYSRQGVANRVPIQLQPIIDETVRLLRNVVPTTVEIDTDISVEIATIKADPTQIQEVLLNLCNNAVYAMGNNGRLKIELDLSDVVQKDIPAYYDAESGRYARIAIHDNGGGIDAAIREKIFDPFFTTKDVDAGTGMGLAVAQGIVKSCGGFILVTSKVGEGSTFELFFPLVDEQAVAEGEKTVSGVPNKGCAENRRAGYDVTQQRLICRKSPNVLLVDDNEMGRQMGRALLEHLGVTVSEANNGAVAVSMVESESFDLILMDIQMPVMDGLSAARAIRKLGVNNGVSVPIVAMTAHVFSEQGDECASAGINSRITKPVEMSVLCAELRSWLPADRQVDCRSKLSKADQDQDLFADLGSKLPDIDVKAGMSYVAGNRRLYVQLLQKFVVQFGNLDKDLNRALQAGHHEVALRLVHNLKGLSGGIGAKGLQEAAALAEGQIRLYQPVELNDMLEQLSKVLTELRQLPKDEIDGGSAGNETGSVKELHNILLKLQQPLVKVQALEVKVLLKKLQEKNWPADYAESISALENLLKSYQFEDAAQLITAILTDEFDGRGF